MQTVKGAQRQVIVLQTGKNHYFEEAFFVVRREIRNSGCSETAMLSEANRILRESMIGEEKRERSRVPRSVWFLLGLFLGVAAALLVTFLRTTT